MKKKNNLDLILQEFANQNRVDLKIIEAVIPYCSHQTQVSFALHCCLDIEPLMTDRRSTNALRAVEIFLKTGVKPSQDVIDAANAAANAAYDAAYAAANAAANAAYAYAYAAANAATNAAYDAANAAYAAANYDPNVYNDKMRGYLNKLKELVSIEFSVDMSEEGAWLMEVTI